MSKIFLSARILKQDRKHDFDLSEFSCLFCTNFGAVSKEYGPRIVVRSIKAIKKFEEVSIAYIDLLQPKVLW